MVRPAGASTRNRKRQLSNKYRLKVLHGDVEADPADFADEYVNPGQYTNLVAGVDAEDANVSPNRHSPPADSMAAFWWLCDPRFPDQSADQTAQEHHLREVLHASSHVYSLRGAKSRRTRTPQTHAFIPTPDSTGIVEHYSDLYAPNRWKDSVTYLCTSISVEESCTGALSSDFTYYMDERDKEWLDKNNDVARVDGTDVQATMFPSVTRRSSRSSVTKGEALESSRTLTISEDEFELVMGLLEKVTHEKTEYLHHGLENGMAFPAFSEYQDTFSSFLSPASFAAFSVPQWIPTPSRLLSIARIIYQYWKERRMKRGGHRIIPVLNLDESDTLNESYVCFRRRETKTLRKTRASQVTSSDKLIRLQAELLYPLELGKQLLKREQLKRDHALHSQQIWHNRMLLVDFKRKFPGWGNKEDEGLLTDKERPKRAESFRPPKIKHEVLGAHFNPDPIVMRPTERIAHINHAIETVLKRQEEEDRQWEDNVDEPYQIQSVPYTTRCFRYLPLPPASDTPKEARVYRALRTRVGRGGRFLFDRRNSVARPIKPIKRPFLPEAGIAEVEDDEQLKRMQERWRFDADDVPTMGPSPSEMDRVLIDDFSPRLLRHSVTFLLDTDQQSLMINLPIINKGHKHLGAPLTIGLPPIHRLQPGDSRQKVSQHQLQTPIMPITTPIFSQQHLKTTVPPLAHQMRMSLNSGMRSSPVASPTISGPPRPSQSSSTALACHSPSNSGIHRVAINLPHSDPSSNEMAGIQSALNDKICMLQTLKHEPRQDEGNDCIVIPMKRQGLTAGNSQISTAIPQTSAAPSNNPTQPGVQGNHGLTVVQMQNLKAAFANVQAKANQETNFVAEALPSYLQSGSANLALHQHLVAFAGSNTDLKLPATRQIQCTNSALPSTKGLSSSGMEGHIPGPICPSAAQAVPVPASSPKEMRQILHIVPNGQLTNHMSLPNQHGNNSPIPASFVHSQSPPRVTLTSTLLRPSP
ncbi:hypothetical protein C0993_004750 [Termitomyces sp. T159_Od127]|nr:hypothetical protein C0993_004750 [Termitomyces sp. T159_Od127]